MIDFEKTSYGDDYFIDVEGDVFLYPEYTKQSEDIILTEDDLEDMLRHIRTKKASFSLKAKGSKQ